MNTNEFNLIMNFLEIASKDGKSAFVWWLLVTEVLHPAVIVGGIVAVIYAAKGALAFIIKSLGND